MIRFRTTNNSAELLVVATGILSDPFMPDLKGNSTLKGPLFHTHSLGSHTSALQNTNTVVVFGASKSA